MCILGLILKQNMKMTFVHENGVLQKAWHLLRTYVLTLQRFDLLLQGALLISVLLESNVFLLVRRDRGGGHTPAYIEDWVVISAGAAEFLLGTLIGWWGSRKRNFALSAWLAIAALSGAIVLFFPFAEERSPYVELCGGDPIHLYRSKADEGIRPQVRMVFLFLTAIVCGLVKVSIWAHGLTYLDDHEPQNGPYFYGILISIRLSLGLSCQGWLQPISLTEDWWKAHLSICCLVLMFAILFTLFPKQMREFPEDERERAMCDNLLSSLGRIVRNRVLVLQTLALGLLTAAVFGFVYYDKAYVQAKFHVEAYRQDPRTSRGLSDIFRTLVIIFFVMIFRVRFSVRRCDGVKACTASRVGGVMAVIVAVFLAVMAALGCDIGQIEGVGDTYQQPICSSQCGCDSARYGFSPVCELGNYRTYFSPCHAGCQEIQDLNGFALFQNCTCGGEQRAVRGACAINDCRVVFSAYQVVYTIFLAVSAAAFLMQGMVMVRAVRRLDKPIALGASFSAVALIAFVGGHGLYMIISYFTCAYYEAGRCVLHSESLWVTCCCSAVLALCSAALSVRASKAGTDPITPTTEL